MYRLQIFRRGVHPPENKHTMDYPTTRLDSIKKVQIPMSMHIGAACTCLVKVGDKVLVGQKIGDSEAMMSAPIHSSVSGVVTAIKKVVASGGSVIEVVDIDSDGLYTRHESVVPPVVTDKESFIKAIRESGLVGLGGASFPTHIKINPPKGKEPEILIINAAECEPYITSDYRQCIEHPDEILEGIQSVMKWLSIPRAIIGIEDNKLSAARLLQFHLDKQDKSKSISIKVLKTMYPEGAEKPLIYHTTGRKVPTGGLPFDVGVLVLNVSTVRFIAKYFHTGMPLVRKRLTMDGGALALQCNVNVPIGAMIPDIIEAIGGVTEEPAKVLMGGPMMGVAMDRIDLGIIKANNAILVLNASEASIPLETQCIRCSRCTDSCPMDLVPTSIDIMSRNNDIDGLKRYHAADCIECGCCTYVCPAKRYLVQSIRSGKLALRLAAASKEVRK